MSDNRHNQVNSGYCPFCKGLMRFYWQTDHWECEECGTEITDIDDDNDPYKEFVL